MDAPITTNIRSGEVYVPSDDGMSDILHNAGHAYAMYLNCDGKDESEMSLHQRASVPTYPDFITKSRINRLKS
jgi:hypothetical protein